MDRSRTLSVVLLLTVVLAYSSASAQVRIRSVLTPQCTSTGNANLKFADIYASGNTAVMGSYNCRGVFIFDITDPDIPVLASVYDPTPNQSFLEAIIIGDRGYFGSGGTSPSGSAGNGDGVHIVDLSDPYKPVLIGKVNSSTGGGFNGVHEMMVFDQGGSRYLLENFNSTATRPLKIIDITNPLAPLLKWEFSPADNAWVHAMHIRGTRLFTSAFTGAKLEIYDISNLASQPPTPIGTITANTTNHSSWTSEDGNYLYSVRETFDGDLRVYDIHDPSSPLLVKTIKAASLNLNAITPHNPVVMGNKLYVSWYQAGVQVFDISNPTDPKRIGQYDTYGQAFAPDSLADGFRVDEPWDLYCGGSNSQNSLPNTFDGNWAVFPFLGEDKVLAGDLKLGLLVLDVTPLNSPRKNVVSDFDGDRKTDLSTFSPSNGNWNIESSASNAQNGVSWGLPDDVLVPADYDGDGRSDIAVWRPSNGTWYIVKSSGTFEYTSWGLSGDVPVPGDYDADGKADIAVWRPSNGTWYVLRSLLGVFIQPWGLQGDKVGTGDYDGDGKADLVVWRPANATWYIFQSSSSQLMQLQWGLSGDRPLITDFDGNGRPELTVFRPATAVWYQLDGYTGDIFFQSFGLTGDIPIPADYDGDGKTDVAVFRPSDSTWYRVDSSDWIYKTREFGQFGDRPSPLAFQPK